MNYNFNNITEYLELKYFNNLKFEVSNSKINIDHSILDNKIDNILKKINILKANDLSNDNEVLSVTETDILSENTDYLFLKPWIKLNQTHKIIKIKEFINNLETNKNDKEIIKDTIIENIKNKKKIKLLYDEKKGKIVSISELGFKNGRYFIDN